MKISFKVLILSLIYLFTPGCDNTLDVNADWKEIAVVYGLLNPTDQVNYVRINKAYLNPGGDAYTLAKITDSLYFDSLDVKMVELRNGSETRVFQLDLVNGNDLGLPKDSGLFSSEVNYLYKLDAKLNESDFNTVYSYKIIIVNKSTGSVVTSFTDMPSRAELLSPVKFINPVLNIPSDQDRSLLIKYREGKLAKMYDAIIRLHYDELDIADTTKSRKDSVDWLIFSGKETQSLKGYEENFVVINSSLFYDNLLSKIPVKPNMKRRATSFTILFYGGGEQLYTYIQVNKPSIGIVQKKPEYTNIEPGLGIFSARYINRFAGIKLDDQTNDYLVLSDKMRSLGFVY